MPHLQTTATTQHITTAFQPAQHTIRKMSLWTQKAEDAFNRGLGYSQEYLDAIRNGAAELRAKREARGPLPVFEPYSSDSELDLEHDNLPLTPPQSPKRDGLDLSRKAWQRSTWGDLSRGMDPSDIIGWGAFEVWQSHMVSKHAPELSASTSLPKSKPNPPGKRARPAIPVSER